MVLTVALRIIDRVEVPSTLLGQLSPESSSCSMAIRQRVQTTAGGVTRTMVYDIFGQEVADYSGSTLERENIYRGGQLLATYEAATSALKYVLQDVQGSTRAVMSNSGGSSAIIARHDYLPFGEEISSGVGLRTTTQTYGAPDTNREKYALTQRDDATGLDHTWWRKYESNAGRWTSSDPLAGSIGDPQSLNRYTYTQNDPVNFVDPSGLSAIGPGTRCVMEWYFTPHIEGGGDWDVREVCYSQSDNLGSAGFGHGSGFGRRPQNSSPEDPCDDKYWPEVERDLSQIATTIGAELGRGWTIRVPRGLSLETAVGRLEASGFVQFYSYNPDHPGVNLQGQLNGRWYHVTVSPPPSPNAAVNANRRPSGSNDARNPRRTGSSTGIREVTAHCETNKPDSWAHRWDYFKSLVW